MSGIAGDEGFSVAVVGATGLVGETMIAVLEERNFPVKQLFALASERSLGKSVTFRDKRHSVASLADFDFSKVDIALFSPGAEVSREFAPKAAAAGCVVIDNTSEFRYLDDVPLVVPEVNPQDIARYTNRGIIANPNCSTIQMVVVLKPLHDAAVIEHINVATYQSVSGAGREAIAELATQSAALLSGQGPVKAGVIPAQIAFNVVPQIDRFEDNGYTREEMKMVWETRKILGSPDIQVNPTAVRVAGILRPLRSGASDHTAQADRCCSAQNPGESARSDGHGRTAPRGYPTAAVEAANRDTVMWAH